MEDSIIRFAAKARKSWSRYGPYPDPARRLRPRSPRGGQEPGPPRLVPTIPGSPPAFTPGPDRKCAPRQHRRRGTDPRRRPALTRSTAGGAGAPGASRPGTGDCGSVPWQWTAGHTGRCGKKWGRGGGWLWHQAPAQAAATPVAGPVAFAALIGRGNRGVVHRVVEKVRGEVALPPHLVGRARVQPPVRRGHCAQSRPPPRARKTPGRPGVGAGPTPGVLSSPKDAPQKSWAALGGILGSTAGGRPFDRAHRQRRSAPAACGRPLPTDPP